MATTRYIIAATASYPTTKTVSTAKAARNEADARAKGDRVDVEVRTQSTDKLVYTAQGAPTMTAMPAAPADLASEIAEAAATATITAHPEAEPTAPAAAPAAPVAPIDEEAAKALEEMIREVKAEAATTAIVAHTAPAKDPQRKAPCGCLVEKIIASGEHGKGCANAKAQAAAAVAVKKDPAPKAPRAPRTGGGSTGRREAQGEAVVPGWELLYDKPRQHAQVGRRAGKYALICTDHKTVRELDRLVQERQLRTAGGWCPSCTH